MSDQQPFDAPNEELFVDKFIGREEFLAVVDEAIADAPNNHVITFVGEGGIGKTALLRRIYKKYQDDDNVVVVQLDYSHARFQSAPTIARSFIAQVAKQSDAITSNDLKLFQAKLKTAQEAYTESKDNETVAKLELESYLFLINKYNESLTKRLVILSDSVEVSFEADGMSRINRLGAEFKNAVIVLAGRPEPVVITRFEEDYIQIYQPKGWQVHKTRNINAFTVDGAIRYFAKVLPTPLKPDLVEKIVILTGGKPVLLAFTAEWFKHNVRLPEEINKSKAELELLDDFHLRQLRKYFERGLVERIRAVREPLDQAILYMSFLDRRYDRRILQLVLERLSPEEIEDLEPKLRRMAFIRSFLDESSGSALLHDEAKRLVNLYAWPPYDPSGEERRALARKIINSFYLPEIKNLQVNIVKAQLPPDSSSEEDLIYELKMECLDYHFRISLDEGRQYVTRLIKEGLSLRKQEGIPHEIMRQVVGKAEAKVAVARMSVWRGKFEGNREILERVLEQKDLSLWYRMTLLSELSNTPVAPGEKAAHLRQALEIAEQMRSQKDIAKLSNALGLIYRRQGLWQKAEDAYQKTLAIVKKVDDPDQKANTLNNMAYVKLLQGELDLAESLADIALSIRQARGNQLGLAFSYLTRGEITEAKGNREQAVRAYQTAAKLFEKLGDDQHHAETLLHLSEARRIERNFARAEELLSPGLGQPLSEVRARAERELGALYRTHGMQLADPQAKASKYSAAAAAFQQSLETSKQKRDWYGQAQALFDLVFMDFLINGRLNEDYAAQLEAALAEHNYPVLKAQLDEVYADLDYKRGEVISAFRQYIAVARTLSTHHIRKYNALFERFKGKFLAQSEDTQQEICGYFDRVIAELPQESRLRSSWNSLCRAIKIAY